MPKFKPDPNYKLQSITYKELVETEWPEEVFIDGGLLSRGDCMMIGATSKGGKSTFLNDLNRECIIGGNFLGFKVVKPLRVLYAQAELSESRLKQRLMPNFCNVPNEYKGNFHVWNTKNRILVNEPNSLKQIHNEIHILRPDIFELDPMINFHSFEENSASDMAKFFRQLDDTKNLFNLAIIMPHHFNKTQGISLLDSMRGSTAMRGWADTTIALESRTPSGFRSLEFELRNQDEIIKRTIKYNSKTKSFDWHDTVELIAKWAKEFLQANNGTVINSTQFTNAMMDDIGNLISKNKSKAYEMKELLISTNVICEEKLGRSNLIKIC